MTALDAETSAAAAPAALANDFPPASLVVWRQLIDKALKGADFDRRLVSRTADGIRIEPLYTQHPDTVTPLPLGPRAADGVAWDIRQMHAGTDPAAVNAAVLEDLAGGATSITLQFASFGSCGLPATTADISRALEGVLLDVCPVALKAGDHTAAAAAALIAAWEQHGLAAGQRLGAFNDDPLGILAETGALDVPLKAALERAAALLLKTLPWPKVSALRADGHIWHTAGASEAQELAAVLATVVAYLRAAESAGVSPAQALPKLAITCAVDADQLMGLAKLRGIRRLIARVASACGAGDAVARMAVTAETSRAMMTRRDPWVNMLRTTMACATAAMGGADCITVLPYSWALGQPDAFARRMARNTSIVLMEESGLGRVADPAGGSFAIESLTADLETAAWRLFQEIEARGGLGVCLADGWWQQRIAATVAIKRADIATGKVPLTGTSAFPRLADDGVAVTPWPVSGMQAPTAAEVTPLPAFRPSQPFEALREQADRFATEMGAPPRVFLACLGPLAGHAARATWIANFLAVGGIDSVQSEPLLRSADAGQAFATSGARLACVCGSDEAYGELGDATVSLLATAGAAEVIVAGRPKGLEVALRAAGAGRFVYAGCDMIETLAALQQALGIPGHAA